MIRGIVSFLIWFLVWLMLSWPPENQDIFIGIFAALLTALVTADIPQDGGAVSRRRGVLYDIQRPWWLFCYMAVFIWECVKANIDVAYRVIHPALPIRPGTIKVKTALRSDAALTFLANSITLTPGTTTVDIDKKRGFIYVHWLYVKKDYNKSSMKLDVVTKFENILKRIFE